MRKHICLLIAASLVSGHVFALPGASFFGKLFRGGTEATAAGHAAEKAAATKGAEHLSAIEPPRGIHTVPTRGSSSVGYSESLLGGMYQRM